MSTAIDVGGIKVTALNDGTVRLPPHFYPGLDFDAHPGMLAADGTYHIPVGCFLIQGNGFTVLVDAGLGPNKIPFPEEIASAANLVHAPELIAEGGLLPGALDDAGVKPTDINSIVVTHMHADHMGWIAPGGDIFFPNAEIFYGLAEEPPPREPAPGETEGRAGLALAKTKGHVRTMDEPAVAIARGVLAHHAPGHTPGHHVVSVTSNGEQAYLLGDVVHHPLQLNDTKISFVSEEKPEHALRTREELLEAFAGRRVSIGMTHLPGLDFQRITTHDGRRWQTVETQERC